MAARTTSPIEVPSSTDTGITSAGSAARGPMARTSFGSAVAGDGARLAETGPRTASSRKSGAGPTTSTSTSRKRAASRRPSITETTSSSISSSGSPERPRQHGAPAVGHQTGDRTQRGGAPVGADQAGDLGGTGPHRPGQLISRRLTPTATDFSGSLRVHSPGADPDPLSER